MSYRLQTVWPAPASRGIWRLVGMRFTTTVQSFRSDWAVFIENRLAVLGLGLIALFAIMAASHPILMRTVWHPQIYGVRMGYDPAIMHPSAPSTAHLLGTDTLGRDVLSQLLAAARPAFVLGLTAAIVTAAISLMIGALAGYYRGWVDVLLSHVSNAALLLPAPLLMMIVGASLGLRLDAFRFGMIYGVVAGLGGAAVVMRAQAVSLMTQPYIDASRVAGGRALHIIWTHLLPGMLPLAATYMMISVTGAIVADGFTSFFGVTRAYTNWGTMVYEGFTYRMAINPLIPWSVLLAPTLALSLFATAFYLVSRGLHQVAEPRLRK
jgi:peptide/nickel transport system permease protein